MPPLVVEPPPDSAWASLTAVTTAPSPPIRDTIESDAPVTVTFTGSQQVELVGAEPHSGSADLGADTAPIWVQETADLTPYAGQNILLRFEYVTDDAVHEQGFLIDVIAIPELNYLDDAEAEGGWTAAGFVRTGHILPQSFIVQRILIGKDNVQVERLQLDENQRGQWLFPLDKDTDEAILIISGNTPVTTATAVYEYEMVK